MPVVKMPDGQLVDMPDNPTPEQLAGLKRVAEPSGWDNAFHKAKLIGSSIVKGAAALPGLIIDAASIDPETGKPPKKFGGASAALQASMTQPRTTGEKYADTGVQAVSGALASPAGLMKPVASAVTGLASAAGSEGAAQLFGDNVFSRLVGGLGGGIAGGLGTAAKTTRTALAREAVRDASEADLKKAAEFQRTSAASGVPINLSQAMGKPSNVDTMVDTLAASKHGTEVARQLRNQPVDVSMGVERELASLPGVPREPHVIANEAQRAATGALTDLKKERTALWEDTLNKGVQALKDAGAAEVGSATTNLAGLTQARLALEKQLPALQAAVKAAQGSDAAAVTAANTKVQDVLKGIQQLESFSLPRGQTSSVRGSLLDPAARGASIDMDQIAREAAAERARKGLPPMVEPADSLQTTAAQKQLAAGQQQVAGAADAEAEGQARLAAARASALQAVQVPPAVVGSQANRLRALAATQPNTPQAAMLTKLAGDLFVDGKPLTRADQINEVLKAHMASLKQPGLATPGVDAGAIKFIQSQIEATRDQMGKAFKPYKAANDAYQVFTEGTYNPVKASVVGRVAGKGYDSAAEAPVSRLMGVFEKGTTPGAGTSEILTLEKALRGQKDGPGIFADAVKTWMSNKISQATSKQGGRPAEATAGNLEQIFTGNDVKSQGFKDMLVGLARSQGLKDDALLPGLQNMMRIVAAAARRPGSVGGTSARQLEDASRSKIAGSVGNFSVIQPIRQPFRALDDWLNADAYSFMDKLLTSPDGVATLIKLGKQPVMSHAAASTLSTFLATNAAAQPNDTQQ